MNRCFQRSTFFLNYLVFPYIEGFAQARGVTAQKQIVDMIIARETLGVFFEGAGRENLQAALRQPKFLNGTGLIRPFMKMNDEDVHKETPWWLQRVKQTRPEYHKVIAFYGASGLWWFQESLVDVFNFLNGILGT